MKKKTLILLGAAMLMMTIHPLLAQENEPGDRKYMMAMRRNMMGIPDLTDTQKDQIKAIKTELEKTVTPLKGEIKVLDAELKKMLVTDGTSERDIDRKIDEISGLRAKMQKLQLKHHREIRNMLTAEQQVIFDKRILEGPHRRGRLGSRKQGRGMQGRRMQGRRMEQRRRRMPTGGDVDNPGESI